MSATQTLAAIVRDSITQCPDLDPYLHDVRALGAVHIDQDAWRHDFWAAFFEPDPAELARYRRVVDAPLQALRDVAVLQKQLTGQPSHVPAELVELLRKRIAIAYFPSADIVVRRARGDGAAAYAQRCLLQYIAAEEWHARGGV